MCYTILFTNMLVHFRDSNRVYTLDYGVAKIRAYCFFRNPVFIKSLSYIFIDIITTGPSLHCQISRICIPNRPITAWSKK